MALKINNKWADTIGISFEIVEIIVQTKRLRPSAYEKNKTLVTRFYFASNLPKFFWDFQQGSYFSTHF